MRHSHRECHRELWTPLEKTRAEDIAAAERCRPRPGSLRVSAVHQGDLEGLDHRELAGGLTRLRLVGSLDRIPARSLLPGAKP
jgi:hypothetical protein